MYLNILHHSYNQDFLRLDKGRLGAINFNNMIPVLENNIEKIDLDKPCETEQEKKYQDLLKKQMYFLNRNKTRLFSKSMKLYKNYIADKLPDSLKMRCCNFPLFEEKCLEYNKIHSLKISELS